MTEHTIASAIVGAQQKWERKPADFYPTPYDATQVLMDFLQLRAGTTVWEPAAGDGDMAAVMEANGLDVWPTDMRQTAFCEGGSNFMLSRQLVAPEWVITNPPFKLSVEFIGHALSITPNVAMLLKSQFWHARSRIEMFERNPPAFVCPLTWRPSFLEKERGKSPLMDVIWVVWKGQTNVTEFVPLRRPTKDRMVDITDYCDRRLGRNQRIDPFDDILGEAMPIRSTNSGVLFDDILGN